MLSGEDGPRRVAINTLRVTEARRNLYVKGHVVVRWGLQSTGDDSSENSVPSSGAWFRLILRDDAPSAIPGTGDIKVIFGGQFAAHLDFITGKDQIIVAGFRVEKCSDADPDNECQLVVDDSTPKATVSVISDSLQGGQAVINSACFASDVRIHKRKSAPVDGSGAGLRGSQASSKRQRTAPPGSSAVGAAVAPAGGNGSRGGNNTKYHTLSQLRSLSNGTVVCAYGVVTYADGPKPTRGSDHALIVKLIDPSWDENAEGVFCNLFKPAAKDLPCPRVGDIMRIHRVQKKMHGSAIQLVSKRHWQWLLFDGRPQQPIDPQAKSSKTFSFSQQDSETVTMLRKWAHQRHDDPLPYAYGCGADAARARLAGSAGGTATVGSAPGNGTSRASSAPTWQTFSSCVAGAKLNVLCQVVYVPLRSEVDKPFAFVLWDGSQPPAAAPLVDRLDPTAAACLHEDAQTRSVLVTAWDGNAALAATLHTGDVVAILGLSCKATQDGSWSFNIHGSSTMTKVVKTAPEFASLPSCFRASPSNQSGGSVPCLTVTRHGHRPVTPLADVSVNPPPGKFRIKGQAKAVRPADPRKWCVLQCPHCQNVFGTKEDAREGEPCRKCLLSEHKEHALRFVFLFALSVRDATGSIDVIVTGEDAELLFSGFPPVDMHAEINKTAKLCLCKFLSLVKQEGIWLDLCVKSYAHVHNPAETKYRVFDTQLTRPLPLL
eukprot:m.192251 g.192251  ORF g.192251 m.192251 type:complete len:715 (+) comp18263_c0_seq3:129-2273(+)